MAANDPSASLIGDLAALGRSQRSKVALLVVGAAVAIGLATSAAVNPGPAGQAEDPGKVLLLLDAADGEQGDFVRRGGFQIERSTLAKATADARAALGRSDGHDIDVVRAWADEALALSPTALKVLKHSFNAETEHIAGVGQMAFDSLELFVATPEAKEGVAAFNDKRPTDFSPYR